ncbi:MAG: 5-formyltetrahydrofolate cyclo-ligase [Thermodesulfobacteriota bacterium]
MMEHVERKSAEKNQKTPLNIDDGWKNKSFISLLKSGSFNIKPEKDSIRNSVGKKRSALSDVEVKQKSLLISDNLYSLEVFKLSNSIALYSPIQNEVRTESIFNKAIQTEKEVYFPRVNGSSLDFHRIHNLEQLQIGKFGVLEPEAHLCKTDIEKIDLFVIPALVFDRSGNRLGYGKGYYDRALADISDSKKVGLSYVLQILDSVPIDKNDRKVGIIVTEQGIVCF